MKGLHKFVALAVILMPPVSSVPPLYAAVPHQTALSSHEAVQLGALADGRPVVVKGTIGGESHDSYVVELRKGAELSVRIASRGNRAGFVVSDTEFGEPAAFGTETDDGTRWVGRAPRAGAYYIAVVAHPTAHYTLIITVRP